MPDPRPLPNCPITEALIDFRIEAPTGLAIAKLSDALEDLNFAYSVKGPIWRGSVGFQLEMGNSDAPRPVSSEPQRIGQRLHSADEKFVAQFTVEGFTLSRLRPYQSWEALMSEARRLWEIYCRIVQPTAIIRVATRYINNLQLPGGSPIDLDEYVRGLPQFPKSLPQFVTSFLQRVVIHDMESQADVIVTQALEQPASDQRLPLILDVDVNRQARFSSQGEEVWQYLSKLRELKNRYFFGLITDKTVALYQ